eukprot:6058363-Prymnesium_polylepis.2
MADKRDSPEAARRDFPRATASSNFRTRRSSLSARLFSSSSARSATLAFCASKGVAFSRALEAHAPLRLKLNEEWLCMRFIASLVETGSVSPSSAATYFGQVQGWHTKEYGVKLAAGMKLNRLPQMLKGLRRTMGDDGRRVRRGVTHQDLKAAMDKCLDPNNVVHANIRAAVSLAFQGLLRGAEFAVGGKFSTRNRRAQGTVDISPRGEPGPPPSVLTPQSPCTVERAVGVGTLYQDTIYASAATTNVSCRSSHRMMYSPVHTVGGSSLPSGWECILGQGHFHPPTCAGATIRAQKVDKSKTIHFDKMCTGHSGTSLPMGHPGQAGTVLTDRRQNILTMKVQAKRHEPPPGASGSGRFHAVGVEKQPKVAATVISGITRMGGSTRRVGAYYPQRVD